MSPLFQAESKALEKRRLRVRPFAPFLFPLHDLQQELREARRSLYGAILFLPAVLFALFLLGIWSFAAWRVFLRPERSSQGF